MTTRGAEEGRKEGGNQNKIEDWRKKKRDTTSVSPYYCIGGGKGTE